MENSPEKNSPHITIQIVGGIVLFLLLFYFVQPVTTPFLLTAAIVYVLYSIHTIPFARSLIVLSIVFLIVWFFHLVSNILEPFILSFLLAYLLTPIVRKLERRKVPRWLASLLLMVIVVGLVVGGLVTIIPIAYAQLNDLWQNSATMPATINQMLQSGGVFDALKRAHIPVEGIQEKISMFISSNAGAYLQEFTKNSSTIVSTVSGVFSEIMNMILVPFLTFYLLKDFPNVRNYVKSFVSGKKKDDIIRIVGRVDVLLSEYVRGSITVALIDGTLLGILLTIFGIRFSVVIGAGMVILYFVPFFGYIVIGTIAFIAALFSGEPVTTNIMLALLSVGLVAILDTALFAPKFIGEKVGIHPVLLIFALFVFSTLFGFIGLVFAVPATAIALLVFNEWIDHGSEADGIQN